MTKTDNGKYSKAYEGLQEYKAQLKQKQEIENEIGSLLDSKAQIQKEIVSREKSIEDIDKQLIGILKRLSPETLTTENKGSEDQPKENKKDPVAIDDRLRSIRANKGNNDYTPYIHSMKYGVSLATAYADFKRVFPK